MFVVIDDVNNYVNNYVKNDVKNDVMRCLELLFAVLPQTLCGHIVVCVCVCVCFGSVFRYEVSCYFHIPSVLRVAPPTIHDTRVSVNITYY